jgi:Fur family zinc uptake transcriptional regulator
MKKKHDHLECRKKVIQNAEEICLKFSLNFTPIRKKVLEIISSNHRPSRAYDLLAKLRDAGFSDKPPTIYRALDFLIENKLVHKLNTISFGEESEEISCFLICEICQEIEEFHNKNLSKVVTNIGKKRGITIKNLNLEIGFKCQECKNLKK